MIEVCEAGHRDMVDGSWICDCGGGCPEAAYSYSSTEDEEELDEMWDCDCCCCLDTCSSWDDYDDQEDDECSS